MPQGKPYRVHPDAWAEFEQAADWYLARSRTAVVNFIKSVSDAFDAISQAPQRWPKYLHGTQRFLLRGFPFSIVYFDDPDAVNIVAVAHTSRKPGYWKPRMQP
jgi:plasmid stabilization system protein ParE